MRQLLFLTLFGLVQSAAFANNQMSDDVIFCEDLTKYSVPYELKREFTSLAKYQYYEACKINGKEAAKQVRAISGTLLFDVGDYAVIAYSEYTAQFIPEQPYLIIASSNEGQKVMEKYVSSSLPYTLMIQSNFSSDLVVY